MRVATRSSGLVGAVLALASVCSGASITGTVKGPDGSPFRGAFVQAQNSQTRITVNVLSGSDGKYRVEKLPAGEYTLRVRAVGFKVDPRTGVSLTAEQTASVDFGLEAGVVRWNDLSYLQGKVLFPEGKGKQEFVTSVSAATGLKPAWPRCTATRMAGWIA